MKERQSIISSCQIGNEPDFSNLSERHRSVLIDALNRGASRRDVMGYLLLSGLTIGAAGAIITTATQAVAATPKKGGRLRYAMDQHGPEDTLDPQLFKANIDYTRGSAHYNNLVQLDERLEPKPELAEEFVVSDDGLKWTFKLRKNVEWHDGSKLSADDVIWSMNRHLGKDSKSRVKSLVTYVKEWKKDDNHTVKAVLEAANRDFAAVLGVFQFKVLKEGTTNFQNPVGTGPFRLKEFIPGVRSVHVRSDNYWRDGGHLELLEIFGITDPLARLNALLAGDVQMMTGLDPKAIQLVTANPKVEVYSLPSGAYNGIVCPVTRSPGNNLDFVLGMKYLQRRDRIVNVILKGQGTIGNDHPISPAYPDHCPEVPQRPYDPDKAKFHLNKSGITSAVLDVAEVAPGLTDTCLILEREAAGIGFSLKVNRVPTDGYWGAVWMKTPFFATNWNMRPTANVMLTSTFSPDSPANESQYKNERIDTLLKATRSERDAGNRKEMYCEIQKLVSDESGTIIPNHNNYLDANSVRVKGIPRVPLGTFGGCQWPEYVWLEG